jgi:catecholate siderophore receptor
MSKRRVFALAVLASALATGEHPAAAQAPAKPDDLSEILVVGASHAGVPLLTQPIIDTPQSIMIIPQEVIEQQARSDLRDVLRNDPSISLHADEDSAQGTNVYIRGFSARYDMYLDGMLDIGNYYRDAFDLEQVDVLTGPSSVLFGRGSTGGAIAQVSKRPTLAPSINGALSIGTDDMQRLTADIDMPIDDGAALRVNGLLHRSGVAGRDDAEYERIGFAPSLALGLNSATRATLSYLHQSDWDRPDYGVPWIDYGSPTGISHPAQVPPDAFYGFKSDYARTSADIATGLVEHDLSDAITLRDQFRYAAYSRDYRATDPEITPIIPLGTPLSAVTVTRVERGGASTETFLDDRADVVAAFGTFGLVHNLVAGGEFGRQTSDPTTLTFSKVPGTPALDPNPDQPFSGASAPKSIVQVTVYSQAAYAVDTLKLDDGWQVTAAARLDRFAANYVNIVPKRVSFRTVDVRPSWRGAVVYKAASDLDLYATYGTSFDPSAEGLSLSAATASLSPERSHTIEGGIKWDANGKFLVTAGLFRTVMVNLRETSPIDPTITILAGTARAEGLELAAQGRLSDRWNILAGYTYLNATILSSPDADIGARLQNSPRHSVKVWTAYDIDAGLKIGGGIDYQSSRVPGTLADGNGFLQEVPGYWTLSAMVRYKLSDHLSLQLNLDNLTDKRYYDGLDDDHVSVGAGRSARFTLATTGW